jgi:peptide/nickel transport system ATP-binding protein
MLESDLTAPSPLAEGRGEGRASATLTDVTVTFPNGARALDGIDFTLAANQIAGLVGESGSGKTTLCRVLAGLQPPTSGHAEVAGQSVQGQLGRTFHRTVQMLLQDAPGSLSPRMTIRALLDEPIAIHRLDPKTTAARRTRLLDRLGLGATLLDRYPHQLSGGQARRVAVARALMLEPRLLIADEPTAGLDLSVQGELLNLLQSLQHELGLTMLVSSHNLGVIRRIASTTTVMYLGQVVEHGPTTALFDAPAHPYTAALLSAHPVIDPSRRHARIVLKGDIPSVFNPPTGCRFHTRCPQAQPSCRTTTLALLPHGPTTVRCLYPLSAPAPSTSPGGRASS